MPGRIGTTSLAVLAAAMLAPSAAAQTEGLTRPTVTIAVSPAGNDAADGSVAHPFRTLTRAQAAVRAANANSDVVVRIAAGTRSEEHKSELQSLMRNSHAGFCLKKKQDTAKDSNDQTRTQDSTNDQADQRAVDYDHDRGTNNNQHTPGRRHTQSTVMERETTKIDNTELT